MRFNLVLLGSLSGVFLLFMSACGNMEKVELKKADASISTITSESIDTPFEIDFEVKQKEAGQFSILTNIKPESGSYIVSPFSEDLIYMSFRLVFEETEKLLLGGGLIETPLSIVEMDSILNVPVRLIRERTTYEQKVSLQSQENFEISGFAEFLIEPICIPYQVAFILRHRSGNLELEQLDTRIAPSYKGRLQKPKALFNPFNQEE